MPGKNPDHADRADTAFSHLRLTGHRPPRLSTTRLGLSADLTPSREPVGFLAAAALLQDRARGQHGIA
jgi:hypothetical protein